MKEVKLNDCELSYAVVSIMGPQSSGKSTLLNHLFGTNFKQMDHLGVRKQTTQGIWLGKAQNIEPCTFVMDLEGTDGGERADDTTFEKQSALFALVVSDILLINMWCTDIGRNHAANKPLLNTVFQAMMKLFSPREIFSRRSPRKITMLFVIRDKSKAPLENLEPTLRKDIQKIWDGVPKPPDCVDTSLSYFFNIEVVALSSYEGNTELFKEEVSNLRERFQHSITPGGLAGDQRVVPASGFPCRTHKFWKIIKEDKDLDLPTVNVMVARHRCEAISNEIFARFKGDEEWRHFEESVQSDYIPGFGKKISSLLDRCLSGYDTKAFYYDEGQRASRRQDLESKLLELITPAYKSLMGHLRTSILEAFKESIDGASENERFTVADDDRIQSFLEKFDRGSKDDTIQQVKWNPAVLKDDLKHDIKAHVIRATKLAGLCNRHKAYLARSLAEPVKSHLRSPGDNPWRDIRELLAHETTDAVAVFESDLSDFELDEASKKEQVSKLKIHGNFLAESWAKEEAETVLSRMKDRFSILFHLDADLKPRVWTTEEEITNITIIAYKECQKLLSVLAEIWLDEDGENIQGNIIFDPFASSGHQRIPRKKTLISSNTSQTIWKNFRDHNIPIIAKAMYIVIVAAQRTEGKAEEKNNWILVSWMIFKLLARVTLAVIGMPM